MCACALAASFGDEETHVGGREGVDLVLMLQLLKGTQDKGNSKNFQDYYQENLPKSNTGTSRIKD